MNATPRIQWQHDVLTTAITLTVGISSIQGPLALQHVASSTDHEVAQSISAQIAQQTLPLLRWGQQRQADILEVGAACGGTILNGFGRIKIRGQALGPTVP